MTDMTDIYMGATILFWLVVMIVYVVWYKK
jgi:hypothetical protein